MEKYGIIIVDMINGFCKEGALSNPEYMKLVPGIKELAEKSQGTYFVCDNHEEDDTEFKVWPPHCIKGTSESEIINELIPFVNTVNVVTKNRYSGLYNTQLEPMIKNSKIKTWVVVGVCTDMCVHYIAEELKNRDYEVIIPKDCTDTFTFANHNVEEVKKYFFDLQFPMILGCKVIKSYKELKMEIPSKEDLLKMKENLEQPNLRINPNKLFYFINKRG